MPAVYLDGRDLELVIVLLEGCDDADDATADHALGLAKRLRTLVSVRRAIDAERDRRRVAAAISELNSTLPRDGK